MAIRDQIIQLARGGDLAEAQAADAMEEIMTGVATPAQIAAFLTALHLKGETDAEIAGMARVMRQKALRVEYSGPTVDTCGTGGDFSDTFNISTTAAFVAAGAGATVAKHGNRAASSQCGSADVLEGLGVTIDLEPAGVARCLHEAGMGFMFAQKFHPAMRFAGPVRREIGIRTVFNVLGPLTNPAGARHQVLGVASPALAEKLARALARLETTHALVIHGAGTDEFALDGENLVYEVRGSTVTTWPPVLASDLGLRPAERGSLRGGGVAENVAILRDVLQGVAGPRTDVVLLTASAALVAADLAADLREGLEFARRSLSSGAAATRLTRMIAASTV